MDQFPQNSKTTRVSLTQNAKAQPEPEAKPKNEKIVTGPVIQKKQSLGKRFHQNFFGGVDARSTAHFVVLDVLLPAAKDMIADAVSQGVERMIFGESRGSGRKSSLGSNLVNSAYNNTRVNYNSISGNSSIRRTPQNDPRPPLSRQARGQHNFGELILATRAEGNEVLSRLDGLVAQYGSASVNDLYEMLGITGDYTDEKWGWDDLANARVHRNRNGYVLDLPRPEPLA